MEQMYLVPQCSFAFMHKKKTRCHHLLIIFYNVVWLIELSDRFRYEISVWLDLELFVKFKVTEYSELKYLSENASVWHSNMSSCVPSG